MQELKQKERHSKRIGGHRDAEKEKHWRGLVQKFDLSGLSVSRFCAVEGLNESNFYSWRKVIKQRDKEQVSAVLDDKPEVRNSLFVPLRVQNVESQVLEIELPGGALVKVTGQTNLALLSAVLRFLGRE
jgi:hypothetical protein